MLITDPKQLRDFYADRRLWQGIPAIEHTKRGVLYAAFYSGGTKEEFGNYSVLLRSTDDGESWGEPIAAAYNGEKSRCYDQCLWIDPLHRLWYIWAVAPEHAVWAVICDDPDADALTWSEEFMIGHDVMMNKPTVLSTGEWLFPIAVWSRDCGAGVLISPSKKRLAFAYRTSDQGKTFTCLGGADVPDRSFDEHMILELQNDTLLMLVRTKYGIGRSCSYDGGLTWTPGEDSGIKGPCSRFFIRRLSSGNVLLVNHYHFNGRSNLTAMLSDDDCRTWKGFLTIDERSDVSYPDAAEAENGFLYIIYDHERGGFLHDMASVRKCAREILMAKITEADILAGKLVSHGSRLRCVVSRLGDYAGEDPFQEQGGCSPQTYMDLAGCEPAQKILDKIFCDYGRCCLNLGETERAQLDQSIAEFLAENPKEDVYRKRFLIGKIINLLVSRGPEATADTDSVVERIFQSVSATFPEDVALDKLAAQLKISKFYMCHLFRQKTGVSIQKYRSFRRISLAKRLLAHTDLSIQAISDRTGFETAAYFAKWFRSETKITAKQYRNDCRTKDLSLGQSAACRQGENA